jgi:hypothetical protein
MVALSALRASGWLLYTDELAVRVGVSGRGPVSDRVVWL